jgi:hypothetical protein
MHFRQRRTRLWRETTQPPLPTYTTDDDIPADFFIAGLPKPKM